MNYAQLTAGLNALTTASRQRNVFLIAARNAILHELGQPFIDFGNSPHNTSPTYRADTDRALNALRSLSTTDIATAEADLAAIVAGRAPTNTSTFSSAQVNALTAYGINAANPRIRTTSTSLNQNHTGRTADGVREAVRIEANRRLAALEMANRGQSTMAPGVDPSVQQSVRNLLNRYRTGSNNPCSAAAIEAARAGLEAVIAAPIREADKFILPPPASRGAAAPSLNAATFTLAEQKDVARRALRRFSEPTDLGSPSAPYQHTALGLSTSQILGLVWTAINDRSSVFAPAVGGQAPTTYVDNAANATVITEAINLRKRNLVAALIEFQTEYTSIDANGQRSYRPACGHGTYNKIVETLNLSHPDVVVLQQDLSITVETEARNYIRNNILPRVFASRENQAALYAAFNNPRPSPSEQQLVDEFTSVMRRALLGELPGQESLYDILRTRVCPTVFTAGQYNREGVINRLIPGYLRDAFPYETLPPAQATAISLTAPAAATRASATVTAAPAVSNSPTAAATSNTQQAVPTGYDARNESRLEAFTERTQLNLEHEDTGQRREIRLTNVNRVEPYRAALALPAMPVCFPYNVTGETDANHRVHGGVMAINTAIRFPAGTISNLPAGVREVLIRNNININNLEVNFCVQDMPWQNDRILLRPHPFLHPTAPQTGTHYSASNVLVGITDINSPFGALANANVSTHGEGGSVVFSTREFPIQTVDPTTGQAADINTNATHAFYSICIEPSTGRAALTLHWMLNDADHNAFIACAPEGNNVQALINAIASSEGLHGSALNREVRNELSPVQALHYLANGHQPPLAQRPSRYRVAEQATAAPAPAASAAGALGATSSAAQGTAQTTVQQMAQQIAQLQAQLAQTQRERDHLINNSNNLQNALTNALADRAHLINNSNNLQNALTNALADRAHLINNSNNLQNALTNALAERDRLAIQLQNRR